MPREFTNGGCLNTASTGKASWGNILLTTDPITAAFLFKLRANGSGSYDVVWGHSNASWFFILNGASGSERKLAFNFQSSGGEKTSGYLTNNLSLNTWYVVIGTHNSAGGSDNTSLAVYTASDGVLVERKTATNAFSISTTANSLAAGYDSVRSLPVNAQYKKFTVWNRVLTTDEQDAFAANQFVDRTSIELETLCNEAEGTTLYNTAVRDREVRKATVSGTASLSSDIPSAFQSSRSASTNRKQLNLTGVVFGNNAIGSSTSTVGVNRYLMGKFTITGDVTVESISFYGNSASGTIGSKVIIYTDNGTKPVVRKGIKQQNIGTTLGWTTSTFDTPIFLPAGTYWLGLLFSNTFNYYYETTGGVSINQFENSSYSNNGSDPYSGPTGQGTLYLSIYANYTTTGRALNS